MVFWLFALVEVVLIVGLLVCGFWCLIAVFCCRLCLVSVVLWF